MKLKSSRFFPDPSSKSKNNIVECMWWCARTRLQSLGNLAPFIFTGKAWKSCIYVDIPCWLTFQIQLFIWFHFNLLSCLISVEINQFSIDSIQVFLWIEQAKREGERDVVIWMGTVDQCCSMRLCFISEKFLLNNNCEFILLFIIWFL